MDALESSSDSDDFDQGSDEEEMFFSDAPEELQVIFG